MSKNFEKKWKKWKIGFSWFFLDFYSKITKNPLIFNNSLVLVTRRAGCLILDSKSNTVSGQIASADPCNIKGTSEVQMWIFDWAPYVRFLIWMHFRRGLVEAANLSYWHLRSIGYRQVKIPNIGEHNFSKKNEKNEKSKKSDFINFLSIFSVN